MKYFTDRNKTNILSLELNWATASSLAFSIMYEKLEPLMKTEMYELLCAHVDNWIDNCGYGYHRFEGIYKLIEVAYEIPSTQKNSEFEKEVKSLITNETNTKIINFLNNLDRRD